MKDRQPSTGTPLGIPEDRLHEGRTSLPLVPLSEYQRTDYKYDGQAFPWCPSRSTRGQTTCRTDKASPWCTLLGMPEDRLHVYRTDEAFPWCTLLGMPEDRLHVGQTNMHGLMSCTQYTADYMQGRQQHRKSGAAHPCSTSQKAVPEGALRVRRDVKYRSVHAKHRKKIRSAGN